MTMTWCTTKDTKIIVVATDKRVGACKYNKMYIIRTEFIKTDKSRIGLRVAVGAQIIRMKFPQDTYQNLSRRRQSLPRQIEYV